MLMGVTMTTMEIVKKYNQLQDPDFHNELPEFEKKEWLGTVKGIVEGVTVLLTHGTDIVFLHTSLPSPFPPSVSNELLTMKFDVACGKGVQYVRDVFGIVDMKVINSR